MTSALVHPAQALYSSLRYWRSAGLSALKIADSDEAEAELLSPNEKKELAQKKLSQVVLKMEEQNKALCLQSRFVYGEGTHPQSVLILALSPNEEAGSKEPTTTEDFTTRMLNKLNRKERFFFVSEVFVSKDQQLSAAEIQQELEKHLPLWLELIEQIKPSALMVTGSAFARLLTGTKENVSQLRGKLYACGLDQRLALFPTYHFSYMLKQKAAWKDIYADLQKLIDFLDTEFIKN